MNRDATPRSSPEEAGPDVRVLWRRGIAHWPVVVAALVLGAVITAQVVRTRTASFRSETVIVFREGIGKNVTGATESPEAVRALGSKLKETLLAQQTLRRIIEAEHLYPEVVARSGHADAVELVRKKTEFKARSNDTFAISFEGQSAAEAQRVCARMAELLIDESRARAREETRSTDAFLAVEKQRADEELAGAEREVSAFLGAHSAFAGPNAGLGTATREREAREAEARRKRERRPGPGPRRAPPSALAAAEPAVDPVLTATRAAAAADLLAARRALDEKAAVYKDGHPDVQAARARLAAAEAAALRADEALRAAQLTARASTHEAAGAAPVADAEPAPARAPRAVAVVPPAASVATGAVDEEMEWTRLSRVLALARSRQGELEGKLHRIELVRATEDQGYGSSLAVLDPAFRPGAPANAPNRTVAVIGLLISLLAGLAVSAAWGMFLDDRVFSAGEIEGIVLVPVIGVIPDRFRSG